MFSFPKVIFETISPVSGRIRVIEEGPVRRLVVGGLTQSMWDFQKEIKNSVWNAFVQPPFPLNSSPLTLILGFGGGTAAKLLQNKYPESQITGVELDPLILDIAQKYFNINPQNINLICADAPVWVRDQRIKNTDQKYDLICVDLYLGESFEEKAKTDEFFSNIYALLSERGIVIFNQISYRQKQDEAKLVIDKLKKLFSNNNGDKNHISRFGTAIVPGKTGSDNILIFIQKLPNR